MTEPARDQQHASEGDFNDGVARGAEREEGSGRFLIEAVRANSTMLPPVEDGAPTLASLDDAEPLPLEAIEELQVAAPRVSVPPPVPAVALTKSARPVALVTAPVPANTADYRGLSISERAEPQVDDLSFHLDNPFAASSLVPPPKRPFPVAKAVLGTVGVALLAASGYAWNLHLQNAPRVEPAPIALHLVHAAVKPTLSTTAVAALPAPVAPVTAAAPAAAPDALIKPEPVATPEASVTVAPKAPAAASAAKAVATTETTAPAAVEHAAPEAAASAPAEAAPAPAPASTEGSANAAATAETAAAAPAEEALPEAPTRDEIMASFEKVRADVTTCAEGGHGMVTSKVTIAGAGRVTYATIEGAFAGTPQGSCMARALRTASFPRFSAPSLKISYPFSL